MRTAWPSLVALLVLSVGGCNRAPVPSQPTPSPKPTTEAPKPEVASKPKADQSRNEQNLPTGWVRIVNRKTGLVLHGDVAKRIEPAGAYWKIRLGESDKFMALAGWAMKQESASAPPRPPSAVSPRDARLE